MEIVVNHLTRMRHGHVCAAGIDPATGRHVRPVWGRGTLGAQHLEKRGGWFALGARIEMGRTRPCGTPPHGEDRMFRDAEVRAAGALSAGEFWDLLARTARPTLREIFGPALRRRGAASCAVDRGFGTASLGNLLLASRPALGLRPRKDRPDQVRMKVDDGVLDLDLGVTDLRFYGSVGREPDASLVEAVSARLRKGEGAILSVGLSRAFSSSFEHAPVHWLQVNNVHLEGEPLWDGR